jgi:hypothetical protein
MEILKQSKLSRSEWDSIEVPVSEEEKEILRLIIHGFSDIHIKYNKTTSLFSFTKIEITPENEMFLYEKYFEPKIKEMTTKYSSLQINYKITKDSTLKKMKSMDTIRLQNLDTNIQKTKDNIYEFLILDFTNDLCMHLNNKKNTKYAFYLYTLIQLKKNSIQHINKYVLDFVDSVIKIANEKTDLCFIAEQAYEFIEQNHYLLKYQDKELFTHQKELFSIFKNIDYIPKLVLYIAPTGTGKTLSPIGLTTKYRVIFVCVARHIGLALAKSAISMEKKVAFAFGCETASDIRLHYYSAVDFTRDKKSGGIRKVDNSNGLKVELMICDVQSYLTAMHYMLAFNSETNIITYWDEPTITMDYENHELHPMIHKNWVENKIPNIVLSCATLPNEEEIIDTLMDFRARFENAEIHNITSYDCKKSIPIVTKDGFCALPHTLYENYDELIQCVKYCESNKTLLRYFDLSEIVNFLVYMNSNHLLEDNYKIKNYFEKIEDITMSSIKIYYLTLFKCIKKEDWKNIYDTMKKNNRPKYEKPTIIKTNSVSFEKRQSNELKRSVSMMMENKSRLENEKKVSAGVLITTEDAYTLTDGPSIFLTEDVSKIAHFYIQQTNIPKEIFQTILGKIATNNVLSEKIAKLEKTMDDMKENKESNDKNSSKKNSKMDFEMKSPELQKLYKELELLKSQIHYITLESQYIPNTVPHQLKWSPFNQVIQTAFVPNIEEEKVKEIMSLEIENYQKVLLLMGIGMFMEGLHPKYLEIMKMMAYEQNLFLIIASSDYIYGTNYSFCHGFISKDLKNMTQQKILQSLGRIGRNNIQQTYSVRFRDDIMLNQLFMKQSVNLEAVNMCKLFCSD